MTIKASSFYAINADNELIATAGTGNTVPVGFTSTETLPVDDLNRVVIAGIGAGGGGGDAEYVFTQAIPSSTWTINHPLNKYPSITVVDSSKRLVEGDVQYVNTSQMIVTFSGSFSGSAYLN
jgi:hypothetical protein